MTPRPSLSVTTTRQFFPSGCEFSGDSPGPRRRPRAAERGPQQGSGARARRRPHRQPRDERRFRACARVRQTERQVLPSGRLRTGEKCDGNEGRGAH